MRILQINSSIRIILFHVFKKETIILSKLSPIEKEKILEIIKPLNFTLDDFFFQKEFSDKEERSIISEIIKSGVDALSINRLLDWKQFENIIATIFDQNGFTVITNFRFKDEFTRYEIDVLAFKYPYLFIIDCKYHKKASSAMFKDAAYKQKKRAEILLEMFPILSDELIRKLFLPLKRKLLIIPLVISWRDHIVQFQQDIAILPYQQLPGFLQEIDEYRDNLYLLNLYLE